MNSKEISTKMVEKELDKSDKSKEHRPKGDVGDYSLSSDDERWEKVSKKPGSDSLQPSLHTVR